MPTKRTKVRAPPPVSDNPSDTDVPHTVPSAPPVPTPSNTELNFKVLRRYNPDLTRILAIAPFAVVYTFSSEALRWEKCGVEGTLFVCESHLPASRNPDGLPAPLEGDVYYTITILNRKALDTFSLRLESAEDIEVTEAYVILQTLSAEGLPVVYGLWIFDDGVGDGGGGGREVVAGVMLDCAVRAQSAREGEEDWNGMEDGEEEGYGQGIEMDGTGDGLIKEVGGLQAAAPAPAGRQIDVSSLFANGGSSGPQRFPNGAGPTPFQHPNFSTNAIPSAFHQQQQQQQQQVPPPSASAASDFFRTLHVAGRWWKTMITEERGAKTEKKEAIGFGKRLGLARLDGLHQAPVDSLN
ncbi:hypothetical protein B0A50_07668 [Salinomyces thailandicus]|uniref:PH domain-like protein n=1 Tax=Salinomyces thailandicus TaxID=706561 RepID=A0A4V5N5P1_9PEZI|nr:hypothetical protein B0A50_07668 [Salinomyces thailandica]